MKIFDIIKKVGGGIIKQVFPAAGAVIDVVNAMLPDDKKLGEDATGEQLQEAIQTLPPDEQAEIMNRKFGVEIEEIHAFSEDMRTLADVDKAGASTRPFIALLMSWLVAYGVFVAITALAYAVYKNTVTIENAWPLVVAILGTPTTLLVHYFGKRTKEKIARYQKAPGNMIATGASVLVDLFKK